MISHDQKIIIVGAGAFGLSTALWLARDGYWDITVFDRCAVDKNNYDPSNGCDGASADINKIFRATYGKSSHYQELAMEARKMWLAWNQDIRTSNQGDLPSCITPNDKLLDICGVYHLADGHELLPRYAADLESMESTAKDFREQQFRKDDPKDEARLHATHGPSVWTKKYHVMDDFMQGDTNGFLDTTAGITMADKACAYVHHLCVQAGVKFIAGSPQGELDRLITQANASLGGKQVIGIKTRDGHEHFADLVIVACGGWTPSIVPEAHRTMEAAGRTVMFIDIPKNRPDLRQKFHPDNMPVWRFIRGEGNTFYEGGGFPITPGGRLKFNFRAKKSTNFQQHPTQSDLRISIPLTSHTDNGKATVPLESVQMMKEVIGQNFPELAELGFSESRLCWCTDSIDQEFVIDYVPKYSDSLFACSGDSGHGFKFLPNLGKYVKDQLERKPSIFSTLWQWRTAKDWEKCNGLDEGEFGPREMSRVEMARPSDYQFVKAAS